jgi:hypothetical protein
VQVHLHGRGDALAGAARATVTADGDCEAVIRLPKAGGGAAACAGLVLGEAGGHQAALVRGGSGAAQLLVDGGKAQTAAEVPTGDWLRLRRNGPTLLAHVSADGRDWRFLARADLVGLQPRLRLGLAAWGGADATGDNLRLSGWVPLGMNVGAGSTWNIGRPFIDLVLIGCGPAFALDADGKSIEERNEKTGKTGPKEAPVDAHGWPTTDFYFKGPYNQPADGFAGRRHLLTFTGKAQVDFSGGKGAGKGGKNAQAIPADAKTGDPAFVDGYDAVTNRSRYYLVSDAEGGLGAIAAAFHKTRRTPDAPEGSGVTDLHLLMPGYTGYDPLHPFTREELDLIGQGRVLRFMDWGKTNAGLLEHWADRVLPGPRIGGDAVQAYEHMVALCNETGSDMWVNIPGQADEELIRKLAKLIKDGSEVDGRRWPGLRPDLNVYVEYSNECWNFGFHIFKQLTERMNAFAGKMPAFGPRRLALDHDRPGAMQANENTLHYRWVAGHLAGTIVPIFQEVFGADQVPLRVRPVLAGWVNNPNSTIIPGLAYLRAAGWEPRQVLYGISPTGYFGSKALAEASGADSGIEAWTTEQGLANYAKPVLSHNWLVWSGLANAHGVQMLAYESGPGIGQTAAMGAAQVDPRFRMVISKGFNTWFATGGGVTNWFSAGFGAYGNSFGDWNLGDNRWDANHPRMQGFQDVALARRTAPLCLGDAVGPGIAVDADAQLGDDKALGAVWSGNFNRETGTVVARYTLRSAVAQDLDLRVGVMTTGAQLAVTAGGAVPVQAAMPAVGAMGTTGPVRVHLEPGINLLELAFTRTGDEQKPVLLVDALDFTAPGAPAMNARPWLGFKHGKEALQAPEGGQLLLPVETGDRDGDEPVITLRSQRGLIPDSGLAVGSDPKKGGVQLTISPPAGKTGLEIVEVRLTDKAGAERLVELPIAIAPAPPRKPTAEATPDGIRLSFAIDSAMRPDVVIERFYVRKDAKGKDWEEAARLTAVAQGQQQWTDPLPAGTVVKYRLHCQSADGVSGAEANIKQITSAGGARDTVATPNALSGGQVRLAGDAEPATALVDGLMESVELPGTAPVVAISGIAAPQGIDTLSFWYATFTNGKFVPDPIVDQKPLGACAVMWTDKALTGDAVLDPANYTAAGKPLDMRENKPTRRLPAETTWSSEFAGLGIPASAKGLLLRFTLPEAKKPLKILEIQGFARQPSAAPAGVKAEAGIAQLAPTTFENPTGAVVTLSWDAAPAGTLGVPVVQRSDSGEFDEKKGRGAKAARIWTLAHGLTTFVNDRDDQAKGLDPKNPALANGATYHYRVGWQIAGGETLWAAPVAVTTPEKGGPLPAVAGLAATTAPGRHIELRWQPVPGAAGYKLERARSADFKDRWAAIGELAAPTWTDRSVDPGHVYHYRVRATTGGRGDGPWSEVLAVTTAVELAPPAGLAATADAGSVSLRWQQPVGRVYAYEVLRGPSPDRLAVVASHAVGQASITQPVWSDLGVPAGTWCYAVRAVAYDAKPPGEIRRSEATPVVTVTVP